MPCKILAREVMSSPPICISPESTLLKAIRLMSSHDIGSVVIAEAGKPVAIITERDVVRCIAEKGEEALRLRAIDCGTRNLLVVRDDTCIVDLLAIMSKWRVRHAPVVDSDGKLVGVVTLRDVAYKIVDEPEILLDILDLRVPELSRDALYLLLRSLRFGREG
ncbi:MAG: CBS domain-containing protein [Desulfurococcales archaeon]|nr:CBS domain-containing protein [Desulfurococcales archaeon]